MAKGFRGPRGLLWSASLCPLPSRGCPCASSPASQQQLSESCDTNISVVLHFASPAWLCSTRTCRGALAPGGCLCRGTGVMRASCQARYHRSHVTVALPMHASSGMSATLPPGAGRVPEPCWTQRRRCTRAASCRTAARRAISVVHVVTAENCAFCCAGARVCQFAPTHLFDLRSGVTLFGGPRRPFRATPFRQIAGISLVRCASAAGRLPPQQEPEQGASCRGCSGERTPSWKMSLRARERFFLRSSWSPSVGLQDPERDSSSSGYRIGLRSPSPTKPPAL